MAEIQGDKLEKLMADQGISQSELARRVGVKQPTIGRLISGQTRSTSVLLELASALNVSPDYLTGKGGGASSDPTAPAYTSQEREWIELLQSISPKDRAAALQIVRSLANSFQQP